MGIAMDVKKLGEDIVGSYDMRVKALGHLFRDVHRSLKDFGADRKKMAEQQAASLAAFVSGLSRNVATMIRDFKKEHKDMSEALSKSLSAFASHLVKNVGGMMKNIQKAHQEMADALKEDLAKIKPGLAKGEAGRMKDFKGMMGNIKKGIKDIETYVGNKLKEFNSSHADMSEALKKDLAKYVAGIVKETKDLLGGYSDEHEKMAANWQSLVGTMSRRRGEHAPAPVVSTGHEIQTVKAVVAKRGGRKGKRKAKKRRKK